MIDRARKRWEGDRTRLQALFGSLLVLSVAPGSPAIAQEPDVRVTNHVPSFLSFYEAVREAEARERERAARARAFDDMEDPDRDPADLRWALWLERYGFPAPPEDEAARERFRERLLAVFPDYGRQLDRIRAAAVDFEPAPGPILREVGRALELDRPLDVHLIVHVGTYDGRVAYDFAAREHRILFPVEVPPQGGRRIALIHTFSEVIHTRLSGRDPDRAPTVAERLLARGLGLRVHESLAPGLSAERYLLRSLDWLLEAERRDDRILEALRPRLARRAVGSIGGLGTGAGPTGLEGELDYAAWRITGHLILHHGWTLGRLARVPAAEVPELVAEAVDEALDRWR